MKTTDLYAVCVGVGAYTQLSPLACPAADAADMAELLQGSSPSTRVALLVDATATKQAILDRIAWLAQSANSDDTALVYLSGHGGRTAVDTDSPAYFCPVDAAPLTLTKTGISSDELTAALRAIRAGRLIVLLDTCFAGGIGEPRHHTPGLVAGLSARDVAALVEGRGRVILAASRPDERAWELGGMRNGLFTSYLLCALRGDAARPDGTVWVSELFGYVSRGVRQHGCQHPYQKAVGEDFVVVVQPSASRLTSDSTHDERTLRRAMRSTYNRAELSVLCHDLGLSLEDLPSLTIETQLMDLIDHCRRHGLYDQLVKRVRMGRPHLAFES